ncbi:MAG: hypothetical protein M5R41_08935 [Bacteroidia bacterium]|nr:hypothetical protein [Bacteroidia bacterium]
MRTTLSIFILFLLCASTLLAQSPPYMNYQGVARSVDGTLLQDKAMSLRISILKNGPTGPEVYNELHSVQTNEYGLFTLNIGAGELRQGALDALDWGKNSYWLQVELDENGGTNYSLLGASQLLSVPYAFHAIHADKADRLSSTDGRSESTGPLPSNGSPWSTRGNVGTDASLDFVGTSDDVALVFRTDNLERMRLTAYGKLGVATPTPASQMDVKGNVTIGETWGGSKAAPESGLIVEGNVGIGEAYPAAKLEVAGEVVVGKDWTGVHLPPMNGVLVEGRVGIGTPSPGSSLGVKGNVAVGTNFSENQAPANGAAIEGKLGVGTTIPKSTVGIAGNTSIGSQYAREFEAPSNGLIVQGDVGFGTEAPLSRLGVAGNVAIGSTYASSFPAPEDGLMVEGPIWSGVTESEYAFHIIGNSFLDGTAEITGNTKVGGTLEVDGVTTIYDETDVPVIVDFYSVSDASFNGSFRTMGGAGVKKNLNVGVDLGVGRDAYVGRDLKVGGTAKFKNLVVENQAEIGTNPDPNFDANLNPNPLFPVSFVNEGDALFKGITTVENATQSTAKNNGALIVKGGVGVDKNVNLGGQMHINYAGPAFSSSEKEKYPIFVEGAKHGMSIKLNESETSTDNNYIGFWDNTKQRGAITGETLGERAGSLEYVLMTLGHVFDVADAAVELISSITDFRVGVGLGVVTVTPGIAKIVYNTVKIILLAAQVINEQVTYLTEYGVAYSSGSADYAEWLERADPAEMLTYGDIVGAHGGKITRKIEGADMVFVISKSPIVLGNVPPAGSEHLFEKCAFLGQVPVKVSGPVNIGDYILPSGRDNGIGMAVAPDDLTAEQAKIVVGVAWSTLARGVPGYVNVAVGMPVKAGLEVLQKQQETIGTLETRMTAMESVLRELIPDLDQRLAAVGAEPLTGGTVNPSSGASHIDPDPVVDPKDREADANILTEEIFNRAVGIAIDQYRSMGHDPNLNPVLRRLGQEPAFRATYLQAMKTLIRTDGDRSELERIIREAQDAPRN